MVFSLTPLNLWQWAVVDAQHKITRVTLLNMQVGGRFDPNLFTFTDPSASPGR